VWPRPSASSSEEPIRTDGSSLIASVAPPNTTYVRWGKRCIDILFSLLALLLLAPLHVLLAVVVRLTSPGPAIFCQKAVGKGGREFDFYKFRSMYTGSQTDMHRQVIRQIVQRGEPVTHDSEGRPIFKILSDPRVTPLGRILRKYSLDELPQLYNVLCGDMSLVGPRPPLPYEAELYDAFQRQRLLIRPGITGLAQVNARHRASFEKMLQCDLEYIRRQSLLLDLKLMLRTVPALLKGV
jgi:lipopolysaccharide/colanic/teichoic acid biosynthesis glycosyltransferase